MDFTYRGITAEGKSIKGTVSADALDAARAVLKGRGLTVVELAAAAEGAKKRGRFTLRRGISDEDIYDMARELSILLKSGVKVDRALEVLIRSTANERLQGKLAGILQGVRAGKGLAQGFEDAGGFTPLTVTMIRAGEGVGDLRSAFENVARHTRFHVQFKADLLNAMAYPIFLILTSVVMLLVIFEWIVPKFLSIFGSGMTDALPLPARMLFAMSAVLNLKNIPLMAVALVGLYAAFVAARDSGMGHKLAAALVHMPYAGSLVQALELSRFSYSMYSMLHSGIEFIHALRFSVGVVQNPHIREALEPSVSQIKEGKGIADVFAQVGFLPEVVPNMLRVGEESGNLEDIFHELYQMFDERFRNSVKKLMALVEPLIIVVMGLVVGFIVVSLMLTVMSVGSLKI